MILLGTVVTCLFVWKLTDLYHGWKLSKIVTQALDELEKELDSIQSKLAKLEEWQSRMEDRGQK